MLNICLLILPGHFLKLILQLPSSDRQTGGQGSRSKDFRLVQLIRDSGRPGLEGGAFARGPGSTHRAAFGCSLSARQGSPFCSSGFFSPGENPPLLRIVLSREGSAKPAGRDALAAGQPKMAALEEEFTLSTGVLGAGPEGFLGVEQSDKADQFLVTDSGRTVVLYKVRVAGATGLSLAPVRSREREARIPRSLGRKAGSGAGRARRSPRREAGRGSEAVFL